MDRREPRRASSPPHGPGDVRGAHADGAVVIGGRRAAEPDGRAAEDRPVADAARALDWPNARVQAGDLATVIDDLKQADGDPLRTIGSVSLVRDLTSLRLVDRLRLVVFPIVLGPDGREPMFAGYQSTAFELVSSSVLDGRLLLLEYRPGAPLIPAPST